jgi:hypothetical protein
VQPRPLPRPLHLANEGAAFLLELTALGIFGWWGATRGRSAASAVLLGAAAPLVAAVVWGLFAAPKARVRLPMIGVLVVKALVFGAATAALSALTRPPVVALFAAIAAANTLAAALDRHARMRA